MKRNRIIWSLLFCLLLIGCGGSGQISGEQPQDIIAADSDVVTDEKEIQKEDISQSNESTEEESEVTEAQMPTPDFGPAKLGEPRSSYGIGSASYLWGRNILISVFVNTPESSFTEEDKQKALAKVKTAVTYIEAQAQSYEIEAELVYDWSSDSNLIIEDSVEFAVNEKSHYWNRMDRKIAEWYSDEISYEDLLAEYDAQGLAIMVFVNNDGISYANVYDGIDSVQESLVLFTGDYYRPGVPETAVSYAHEILHVFGAHDLYEDAEYTAEVTDYIGQHYPREIMYTVSGSEGAQPIHNTLSPITAYHLGWVDEAEEVTLFPQLERL